MKNVMLMMSKVQSGGGYFSLKKVLSIILILTILIIPFQTLLNVKAEKVVITTDETKTLEENTDFQYVKNTITLEVESSNKNINSFSAFKILDVYYNKITNEMTYDFTSDFKGFINQLPSNEKLTVEDYQGLTSDASNGSSVTTTSTLNELISKYATYLNGENRKENLDSIEITKKADDTYTKEEVVVGSYLVLPTEVVSKIVDSTRNLKLMIYTYGVSIANVNFIVSDGNWTLDKKQRIYAKNYTSYYINNLFSVNIKKYFAGQESPIFGNDITYSANKDLVFYSEMEYFEKNYQMPSNTHESILNNTAIMEKIPKIEYIFPDGIKLDKLYYYVGNNVSNATSLEEAIIRDGKLYYVVDGEEKLFSNVINDTENNKLVVWNISKEFESYAYVGFTLKVNNNANTTNGNIITTNAYYLKDAYVDISGMSQEEAEEAVLGVATLTNTVYTYGVKVTNKDNSTLLNGAKFQVCLDENCNTKVGEEFEITDNGTYTFKGLNDTDTYYLKQTKASTGYKMASTITLSPTSLNKETGYYDVEVTSAKMGLLPTTGGLGTILYTTFGLLIIVVGSITFISYRKRQVNVNN